ncbi:MAG: HAMP domain-containing histidine kinase [Bacteroidales bacterium]|nr:HAMP domain-containing histidine kinase [Bacteroidales bacterium]MCF8387015.1 HAMP domain-containing histidine kinase [Bacteroidales bacterium]MCF8397364.1 HAMP domain-containing histidine kinase [Bacteroidales bacterium]
MNEILQLLKKAEMFSAMRDEVLEKLSKVVIRSKVKAGVNIIKKSTKGKSMYIIAEGTVRVHDGNHVLTRLKEGDVFGEYALLDEEKRSASVTADTTTLTYQLQQEDFYQLMSSNTNFLNGVLKVLIKRLRERNELEEKLARSYKKIHKQKLEIEEQHENIKEQKQQLEQHNFDLLKLNEEKNQIMSVVIHGLKNPLTSSLCMADMLSRKETEEKEQEKEQIELICKSLRRMNSMINQMLDINTIESKKIRLNFEKIYISQVVRDVVKNFKPFIDQKKLQVELKLQAISAKLNEVYLFQIIDNLVSNAVNYSPEGGGIRISLFEEGPYARLEIVDEGPGIPSDQLEKIFHKYHRQSTKLIDTNEQSGLGLAIVKKYVEAMKGEVWCESEEGKGARFIVRFRQFIETPDHA